MLSIKSYFPETLSFSLKWNLTSCEIAWMLQRTIIVWYKKTREASFQMNLWNIWYHLELLYDFCFNVFKWKQLLSMTVISSSRVTSHISFVSRLCIKNIQVLSSWKIFHKIFHSVPIIVIIVNHSLIGEARIWLTCSGTWSVFQGRYH